MERRSAGEIDQEGAIDNGQAPDGVSSEAVGVAQADAQGMSAVAGHEYDDSVWPTECPPAVREQRGCVQGVDAGEVGVDAQAA